MKWLLWSALWCLSAPTIARAQTAPAALPHLSGPVPRVADLADLADGQPSDRSAQTLRSLGDRYGVLVGDPDRQFRGEQALNRTEFAAGLEAVMQAINQRLQRLGTEYTTPADLAEVRRLQAEYTRSLVSLHERLVIPWIDRLPDSYDIARLNGEANLVVSGFLGDSDRPDATPRDRTLTLGQRAKLELTASFFGKDQLTVSLRAGNLPNQAAAIATDMARLGLQGNSDGQLELDEFIYRFPVGRRTTLRVMATGGSLTDIANPLNSFLDDTGDGAVSRFAQRNPIFRQGNGSGLGITHKFNDRLRLSAGFLADDANDPLLGLTREYGAIAQLTLSWSERVELSVTYVRGFNAVRTGTGSQIANSPFRATSREVISNAVGLQAEVGITPKLFLSGWVGITQAIAADLPDHPRAESVNWALTLAVPDLGGDGNLLGLAIGQPPKVTRSDFIVDGRAYADPDSALHLEAFYRWRLSDHINLTAGGFVVTHPEHDRRNSPIFMGILRTTFNF